MLYAIKTDTGWYVKGKPNHNRKYEFTKKLNEARIFRTKSSVSNTENYIRKYHDEIRCSIIDVVVFEIQ